MGPLLHERDLYLAWSCKRSKAVCGARAVVGVIGRSHMFGTAYHLLQVRELLHYYRMCTRRSHLRVLPGHFSVVIHGSRSSLDTDSLLAGQESSQLRFRDLVGGRNVRLSPREQAAGLATRLAREAALAAGAYAVWQLWTGHSSGN